MPPSNEQGGERCGCPDWDCKYGEICKVKWCDRCKGTKKIHNHANRSLCPAGCPRPCPNCHPTQPAAEGEENWVERFDKEFGVVFHLGIVGDRESCSNEIKSFIANAITSERQAAGKRMEGVVKAIEKAFICSCEHGTPGWQCWHRDAKDIALAIFDQAASGLGVCQTCDGKGIVSKSGGLTGTLCKDCNPPTKVG